MARAEHAGRDTDPHPDAHPATDAGADASADPRADAGTDPRPNAGTDARTDAGSDTGADTDPARARAAGSGPIQAATGRRRPVSTS